MLAMVPKTCQRNLLLCLFIIIIVTRSCSSYSYLISLHFIYGHMNVVLIKSTAHLPLTFFFMASEHVQRQMKQGTELLMHSFISFCTIKVS